MTAQLESDIERVDVLWAECRHAYGAELRTESAGDLRHALADPTLGEWQSAAEQEGHPLPQVDQHGELQN
jgi:hypothetical protein